VVLVVIVLFLGKVKVSQPNLTNTHDDCRFSPRPPLLHHYVGHDPSGVRLARVVGVRRPELIRVVEAIELPFPADPELTFAATQTGLLGPHMAGLTLGYAVFVRAGHRSARLLSHECRHVYQYESAGSRARCLMEALGVSGLASED
jgi:hypothetical protein